MHELIFAQRSSFPQCPEIQVLCIPFFSSHDGEVKKNPVAPERGICQGAKYLAQCFLEPCVK